MKSKQTGFARSIMKPQIGSLLGLVALLVAAGGAVIAHGGELTVRVPAKELVAAISNHDIIWDLTPAGLLPHVNGATVLVSKYCGDEVNGQLVDLLDDPTRFQAAHVLLGPRLWGEVSTSGGEYDHLRIVMDANGRTTVDPAQRAELKKLWKERLKQKAATGARGRKK
jgi:hypothetical protein